MPRSSIQNRRYNNPKCLCLSRTVFFTPTSPLTKANARNNGTLQTRLNYKIGVGPGHCSWTNSLSLMAQPFPWLTPGRQTLLAQGYRPLHISQHYFEASTIVKFSFLFCWAPLKGSWAGETPWPCLIPNNLLLEIARDNNRKTMLGYECSNVFPSVMRVKQMAMRKTLSCFWAELVSFGLPWNFKAPIVISASSQKREKDVLQFVIQEEKGHPWRQMTFCLCLPLSFSKLSLGSLLGEPVSILPGNV